jgi:hypothetical protein
MITLKRTIEDSEYYNIKKTIEDSAPLIKIVSLAELNFMDDNILNVGGRQVMLSENTMSNLMKHISIPVRQQTNLKRQYGKKGFNELGNILLKANSNISKRNLLFTFDKKSGNLSQIKKVDNSIIPLSAGFSLVDILRNHFNLKTSEVLYDSSDYGFSVNMYFPNEQDIQLLDKGEEHIFGITVDMNPDNIVLSSFVNRLVCENGTVVQDNLSKNRLSSIDYGDVKKAINIVDDFKLNIPQLLQERYDQSKNTKASISEIEKSIGYLTEVNIPKEIVMQSFPMDKYKHDYMKIDIDLNKISNKEKKLAKSDMTIWEMYNRLTEFATHTEYLTPNSISRNKIMTQAGNIIMRKKFDLMPSIPSPY